jgi:hypothetical protein
MQNRFEEYVDTTNWNIQFSLFDIVLITSLNIDECILTYTSYKLPV